MTKNPTDRAREVVELAQSLGIEVRTVDDARLDQLANGEVHQGVVAQVQGEVLRQSIEQILDGLTTAPLLLLLANLARLSGEPSAGPQQLAAFGARITASPGSVFAEVLTSLATGGRAADGAREGLVERHGEKSVVRPPAHEGR
jgi:hypothetical protein